MYRRLWIACAVMMTAPIAVAKPLATPPRMQRIPVVQSLDALAVYPPAIAPIDGVRHLVHELHLTNFTSGDAVVARIELFDERGGMIGELREEALRAAMVRLGAAAAPGAPVDPREIGPGLRSVVYLWLPLTGAGSPSAIRYRIELSVSRHGQRLQTTMHLAPQPVRREPPIALGPPLRGGRWVAAYGPAADRGHRRVFYTLDGRARIPARFAIDWMKLGDDDALASTPRAQLASWHGYGAEVLAVADATVVDARDDVTDEAPISGSSPTIALEQASGNYVVLDLGRGRHAIYEHLKPGSVRVRQGARVRRGEVIAALGNTGSSSGGPHLHFHVADAASVITAEGLPYVFDRFEVLGAFTFSAEKGAPGQVAPAPAELPAVRRRELPAPSAIVQF